MARIRSAKPEWWSKEKWAALPRDIRFTYKGIWEVMADDQGRFQADARLIKAQVWPLDDDITTRKIEAWLARIRGVTVTEADGTRAPALLLYEVDGIRYGYLPGFVKHQKISHPTPSKLPAPPESFQKDSRTAPELLRPEEEGRGGGVREGLGVRSGEEGNPAPPRVVLPREATAFLAMFYEPCLTEKDRDRYKNVKGQLYDVLDPEHPGPKLKGGKRVKARSPEHLVDTMRAVMSDPPPNRDLAIVWLLNKLLDPPKGPSETELHKRSEAARVGLEEAYAAAAKSAGVQWAKENPELYAAILRSVDANYRGNTTAFAKMARDTELAQRCAREAQFPPFEKWLETRSAA